MPLKDAMSSYDRRARLYPMVLVLVPVGLGVASWIPQGVRIPGLIGGAVVVLAAAAFLTQLARDCGKRREKELYRLWGGRPSDRALSYSARVFAEATLSRWHRKLVSLDPNLHIPESLSAEKADPKGAKEAYSAATDLLVAKTRDKGAFPLLFHENMNYGFRRNLWGMKAIGIGCTILGGVASGVRIASVAISELPNEIPAVAAAGICLVLLVIWIARVTPAWVRIPADGYAKHLAEACEVL
jgi:hypothetical protein